MVQQSNSVSSNEAAERISSDAEFRDSVPVLLQLLESGLDLVGDTLAAELNAVVGEAARVALGGKNVKIGVPLFDAGIEELQVVWMSPKTEVVSPC